MFGIGKKTRIRDAIGVTVAIVAAVLLLSVTQLVPVADALAHPEVTHEVTHEATTLGLSADPS